MTKITLTYNEEIPPLPTVPFEIERNGIRRIEHLQVTRTWTANRITYAELDVDPPLQPGDVVRTLATSDDLG